MNDYSQLIKKIGIEFKDESLLNNAFVHKSYVNENKESKDNERLEFLGDAVLELVATRYLYDACPDSQEGELTAFRSALVKGKHLAQVAEELDLGTYLLLSHGEERSGGRNKKYILANTVEALIGAIYLDQGYEVAKDFISKFILTRLDEIIAQGLHIDAKSKLQEVIQEKEDFTPYYEVISEEGPDHNKLFTVGVYIKNELVAQGQGTSKQKAEVEAAENALKELKV